MALYVYSGVEINVYPALTIKLIDFKQGKKYPYVIHEDIC